jgi:hypothetical protein
MWFKQWRQRWLTGAGRIGGKPSPRTGRRRPTLERLEDRSLPSSFAVIW